MNIFNKKILDVWIFYSSLGLVIVSLMFSLKFITSLFGLIPVPFSILSSYNKKYLKASLILSFISSFLVFPNYLYPFSIILSFITFFNVEIGTLVVGTVDFLLLIMFIIYEIFQIPIPNFFLLSVSLTNAYIGFLSLRGIRGYDYNIIEFIADGISENQEWYLKVNGVVYYVRGKRARIFANKGKWVICPIYDGTQYLVPSQYSGESKGGKVIHINFTKSQSFDPKSYVDCTIHFVGKGIPVDFTVNVEGTQYSGREIIVLPKRAEVNWNVNSVTVGGVLFEPKVNKGKASIGETVVIDFEPILLQRPSKLDVNKWDPQYWKNQVLFGYKVIDVLGEGGISYVLKAEKEGKSYALKVLKVVPSGSQTKALRDFLDVLKESNNLIQLSNFEGLVKLYGVFVDLNQLGSIMRGDGETYLKYPPTIIMEYMEGGTLKELMKMFSSSIEWYKLVKIILLRVAKSLTYIHNAGYVHLDIKPQNIFFSEKLPDDLGSILALISNKPEIVKLGDLGSATKVGGKITQVTPEYSSPKQLEYAILGLGAQYEMDIFSLGMVLYHTLTGKTSPASSIIDEAIELFNKNDIRNALLKVDEAKRVIENWSIDLPQNAPKEFEEIIRLSVTGQITSANEFYNKLASVNF